MTPTLLVVLLLLALAIPVLIGAFNWLRHREITRQAAQRGWRTAAPGWRRVFRPEFRLAGTLSNGSVWEMHRFWRDGRLLIQWRAYARSLPYGRVNVIPVDLVQPQGERVIPLKIVSINDPSWPDRWCLLATHDQLARYFVQPAAVDLLNQFQPRPQSGALEQIVWQQESLTILCIFDRSWLLFEQIVQLGDYLLENSQR